jgi:NAD(P)H-hydrate epimerase
MPGAAFLSAKSAFASGAGYVAVASERRALHIIKNLLPEAVFIPVDYDGKDTAKELIHRFQDFSCIVIGPGLSREAEHQKLAVELIFGLSITEKPSVIDGDGLYALSNIEEPLKLPNSILTPHPKEAERLLDAGERNPLRKAERIAEKYGCGCVYKGATTVVSDGRKTLVFDEAVNNLAVAGSGDVLSGVIAALLAQGFNPFYAASAAVKIQSAASRLAFEYLNGAPLLASEMIDYIRVQFENLCGDWL